MTKIVPALDAHLPPVHLLPFLAVGLEPRHALLVCPENHVGSDSCSVTLTCITPVNQPLLLLLHGGKLWVLRVGVELGQFGAQGVGVGVRELHVRRVHLVVRVGTLEDTEVKFLFA